MKQGTEYTKQRAAWFGVEQQHEGENDMDFRRRVAGVLRDQGKFIEAHEALNNALYDDPEGGCEDGIMGAVAMAMQGIDYGSRGSRRVEDEAVAGMYLKAPKMSQAEAMLMMLMLGNDRR